MKKIIAIVLATIAIAATALIAVPALAKDVPAQAQTAVQTALVQVQPSLTAATNSLYTGYGAAFCGGGLTLGDKTTLQRVATTLGITYDQLVQRLQNGETIAAIATAQKVDISKVVDTIVAAQTDMVNVLLKYGYITQDQANTIVANLRTRVESALSATTPTSSTGYGFGMMGGGFGYGMMGGTFSNGLNSTVTPPVTGPLTGYGFGMMGGIGRGMMGW